MKPFSNIEEYSRPADAPAEDVRLRTVVPGSGIVSAGTGDHESFESISLRACVVTETLEGILRHHPAPTEQPSGIRSAN